MTHNNKSEPVMGIFDRMEEHGHEELAFCYYPEKDLKAIIAFHNTALGNAIGGCRMFNYRTEEDAIEDAIDLSRIMTFQAAISGADFGGGKVVLWKKDSDDRPDEGYFRALGRFIEGFKGRLVTCPDLGTDSRHMAHIACETNHVILHKISQTQSQESEEITASAVLWGMKACVKQLDGASTLEGLTIAIQGVGSVGCRIAELVKEEGAKIIITDLKYDNLKKVQDKYPDTIVVPPEDILSVECDILSPCAIGPVITWDNIDLLKCRIIAGAAYNILDERREQAIRLHEKGILYAPDFVINAGEMFLTQQALEIISREEVLATVHKIYDIMAEILEVSRKENIPPQRAAFQLASKRINDIARTKGIYC
ncbi:MAG: Glu/Leu/Phe/Val dehydrogenase [candidate division Zixibacteria bacterium]|nr:Glu/Leu/Phe/Val dehydrogenase [candidate division Zixibacteria bacterium]